MGRDTGKPNSANNIFSHNNSQTPHAHFVPILTSDGILSYEEVKAFRRFVASLDPPPAVFTSTFAHSGTSAYALNASLFAPSSSWVIDSGASHHVTGMSSLFFTYHVCSGSNKVRIADGSYSSIAGKGNIIATPFMYLSSIFHVPNFSLNLLSIKRITKSLYYNVTFLHSHYVFQDLDSK